MLELRRVLAGVAFVGALFLPRAAAAQLHWDASLQAGVMKRFLVERPAGAADAGFGPAAQITGHIALLPLVHVGAYFGHDVSPLPGAAPARQITWGGVRAKTALPLTTDIRGWFFLGFGYAGTFAPGYGRTLDLPNADGTTTVRQANIQDAGGGFFDLPFGIGASYKLRKPWSLCAELGAHVGFGHQGSVYEDPGPQAKVEGLPDQNVLPSGLDRFALVLTVGVMLER